MKANAGVAGRTWGWSVPRWTRSGLMAKVRDYLQLVKTRLSSLVLFTTAVGYLLAAGGVVQGGHLAFVLFGAFSVIGAANAFNQVLERDADALMRRTRTRPLPAGRMSVLEASVAATAMSVVGLGVLWWVANPLTVILALVAEVLYVLAYTPLKRWTPLCTVVGAIPGAIPPLLGWAAVRGTLAGGAWALFLIQFLWQFPHFWSIAWLCRDDYRRAGFRMLPLDDADSRRTARQILLYSLTLVPVGWLPAVWGMGGLFYGVGGLLMASLLVTRSLHLWRHPTRDGGRKVMFAALLYLPVVLLLLLLGR